MRGLLDDVAFRHWPIGLGAPFAILLSTIRPI